MKLPKSNANAVVVEAHIDNPPIEKPGCGVWLRSKDDELVYIPTDRIKDVMKLLRKAQNRR